MKRIINGKVYDTDTAKEVGKWENYGSWRDFNHMEETLYQKRTGEFFLYGQGGPHTKYAVSVGQTSWEGGSKIIPLTWENARDWAEKNLDAEDYERIFGEVLEDDSRVVVTLSLSAGVVEFAKRKAAQNGVSLSAYFESVIKELQS